MHTKAPEVRRDTIPAGKSVQGTEAWQGEQRPGQPREMVDLAARVKVINPLTSSGPARAARVHNRSAGVLKLLAPRQIFVGALVQVLMPGEILLGEVRSCSPRGPEFDIAIRIVELL